MQYVRIEEHHQAMPLFTFFAGDIHNDEAQSITDLWGCERNSWRGCQAIEHVLNESGKRRVR